MSNDRRRKGADFDSERTIPAGSQRREAPRIATPLAPELKPAPAAVQARRPGSVGMPPVDTATPVPAAPQLPAANPLAAPMPAPSGSAVPVAVAPERSSRSAAPVPAAPDRSSRGVGTIVERVRDAVDPRRESAEQRPVSPAQQAAHAAAVLAQAVVPRDTIITTKATLASTMTPGLPGEIVRIHRMPAPAKLDPRLFMLRAPDSEAAAAFRVLRHRLAERTGLKVILVTSADRGEGKTLCAVNLALTLGEAGRARVLLAETNFRRPALANLFGIRPPICFSEQLEFHKNQPGQPWVVVENVSPYLHLAAVSTDTPSRPMLDGPALLYCMEQLRLAAYDYIVLDSPSVLESADVNLIEESADGILFTMWSKRSRARSLRKAIEQVGSAKVLGVTLLGA